MTTQTQLVKRMQDAGINVEAYKRGPLGKGIFAVSISPRTPEGTVRIWKGTFPEVEIHTDKRNRQAVLSVVEQARTVSRKVEFHVFSDNLESNRDRARRQFNRQVTLPAGSRIMVGKINLPERNSNGQVLGTATATVSARVPHSEQNLLVGFDERYHFVAELPRKVKSVREAHKVLRPRAANKKETLRQGEWFFVPVNESLSKKIMEFVQRGGAVDSGNFESGSTHQATSIVRYKGERYATGYAFDSRFSHHGAVALHGWHRVVRNREVVRNVQAYAPRRTWD